MPSMASVWPITPPEYRVNAAQFVPNWNSMGIPVTTPTAKVRPRIFAQNRTATAYRSSPVRRARHFQNTRNHTSPIVSWGNR